MKKPVRLVITGGPSAGKTTVAQILNKEFHNQIAVVPEAATILFQGGIPRGPQVADLVFQQRAIYLLQKELEEYFSFKNSNKLIVCDRGSLDGVAYWPAGARTTLFKSVGSSEAREINRYDWVIHLDTAARPSYALTNVRQEDFSLARKINTKILRAWDKHPRRVVIQNSTDFSKKIALAILIINMILDGHTRDEICQRVAARNHRVK